MASDFGWAGLRRERRPRYSQSHDSLLDTRADYAAGLRRRLERGRVVGWPEIRRFASCLPTASQAKWVRVESSVNLDASGNPDPYYVSIDLATARHPQTLLATHFNGQRPDCGAWSAASSAGARETRLEECEGNYQADVCRAGAARLLGRTRLFPLRRNLTKESSRMTQVITEPLSRQQGKHTRSTVERIAAFAAAARPRAPDGRHPATVQAQYSGQRWLRHRSAARDNPSRHCANSSRNTGRRAGAR